MVKPPARRDFLQISALYGPRPLRSPFEQVSIDMDSYIVSATGLPALLATIRRHTQ